MVDQAAGGGLTLSFQDLGGAVGTYNIYEGTLGGGYNHAPKACAAAVTAAGGRLQATLTPAAGNTYYLVTAADLCQEGTSGSDSSGTPQPSANLTCSP
jgi:hypothetical protein